MRDKSWAALSLPVVGAILFAGHVGAQSAATLDDLRAIGQDAITLLFACFLALLVVVGLLATSLGAQR